MMAMFVSAVESSIVAIAMPTIVAQLGGFQLFSWVFSSYLLTQTVTIPIYGRMADLYGRKRVFYLGTGIFLVGSLLCGFAPDMVWLIVFRAIQGFGSGAILPIATTIVADVYTGEERARMQGYLSSVWGVAAILGPTLGAFLAQHAFWPLIFWGFIPIGIAAIAMIATFLNERLVPKSHQVDYFGAGLMTFGVGLVMLVMTEASSFSWAEIGAMLAAATVALVWLAIRERLATEPMLPLALWRNRVISVSNAGGFSMGMAMMGVTAFLPAYMQGVMGESATVAGIALTIMSLTWSAASTLSGQLMVRTTFRTSAAFGGVCLFVGSLMLVLMIPDHGLIWATVASCLVGAGLGACNTTFLVAIQSSVDWQVRGIATSSNLFSRMMGRSLGAAVFGAVLNFGVNRHLPGGGDVLDRLMDPTFREQVDPAELGRLTAVIADSLRDVYIIAAITAAATLIITLTFPARLKPSQKLR
jgi:EmrB/QacA subfamily drug resistance transporter